MGFNELNPLLHYLISINIWLFICLKILVPYLLIVIFYRNYIKLDGFKKEINLIVIFFIDAALFLVVMANIMTILNL